MASNELDRKGAEDQGTNGGANFLQPNGASGTDLSRQISVTLTPEQFESLYLQPSQKSRQQGELIKALGNPTGLGVICFIFNLLPTSCILMGFRGLTAPAQVPILGVYYFVGAYISAAGRSPPTLDLHLHLRPPPHPHTQAVWA